MLKADSSLLEAVFARAPGSPAAARSRRTAPRQISRRPWCGSVPVTAKPGRALLDQHAADALAARLAVDAGEHDEHARLVGAADQRLDAVEHARGRRCTVALVR